MKNMIRRSAERGIFDFGWLQTRHSFSFGEYHDPRFMGFSSLRVINEDTIAPGAGFPTHGHRDMEIISVVLEGALEHKDSMGHSKIIRAGEMQVMSAGTGVQHSEFNHYKDRRAHFFQIWIMPNEKGVEPSYQQKDFSDVFEKEGIHLFVSGDPKKSEMKIHQDARVFLGNSTSGLSQVEIGLGRSCYLQMVHGELRIENQIVLQDSDGLALADVEKIQIECLKPSRFLLFDLPAAKL